MKVHDGRWHYFLEDRVSLCGNWQAGINATLFTTRGRRYCTTCKRGVGGRLKIKGYDTGTTRRLKK